MTRPRVIRADEAQRIAWLAGTVHTIAMDGASTGGRLTVLRTTFLIGTASPVHVHDHDDETFCVLAGNMIIWAGKDRWELGAGDTAFLPRAVPHAYLVTSATADVLTVGDPAGVEQFFQAAGWDLREPLPDDWSVDPAALGPLGERAGQRVLGPPLARDDRIPDEVLARP